ncbi:MAG: 50S ribosomal protein L23 [Nitrososphaeraceae archaeon]|nr:50S ribosomal protein L23 [Nitrososphaeraceae archaeon]
MNKKNKKNIGTQKWDEERLVKSPYVTEKTFNLIEKENKLIFIVDEHLDKTSIKKQIKELYESDVAEVNTVRTINGKKAIIRFKEREGARQLATKLGIV